MERCSGSQQITFLTALCSYNGVLYAFCSLCIFLIYIYIYMQNLTSIDIFMVALAHIMTNHSEVRHHSEWQTKHSSCRIPVNIGWIVTLVCSGIFIHSVTTTFDSKVNWFSECRTEIAVNKLTFRNATCNEKDKQTDASFFAFLRKQRPGISASLVQQASALQDYNAGQHEVCDPAGAHPVGNPSPSGLCGRASFSAWADVCVHDVAVMLVKLLLNWEALTAGEASAGWEQLGKSTVSKSKCTQDIWNVLYPHTDYAQRFQNVHIVSVAVCKDNNLPACLSSTNNLFPTQLSSAPWIRPL